MFGRHRAIDILALSKIDLAANDVAMQSTRAGAIRCEVRGGYTANS